MELFDKIQELWGRTLSPIETYSIIAMIEEEHLDEKLILEVAMMSVDKSQPFYYMKKVLYNIKHPLEKKKEEEPVEEPKMVRKSKWLEEFLNEGEKKNDTTTNESN